MENRPQYNHYSPVVLYKNKTHYVATDFTPMETIELNVQVVKARRIILTIRVAQSPEARHGVLWQVIFLPSSIVVRVVHFLLGVKPLVSRHGYTHDDKWNGGSEWG